MNKTVYAAIFLALLASAPAFAAEQKKASVPPELLAETPKTVVKSPAPASGRSLFVVDTAEFDTDESLNRISGGDYERFLKADLSQSFESKNHYGASPFDYSRSHENDDRD